MNSTNTNWIELFVLRWEKKKILKAQEDEQKEKDKTKDKQKEWITYTLWTKVQIRGKGENPNTLSLYVPGFGGEWTKAGILKKQGDEWIFQPNKTSFAAEILEAIITKYLT